jgi:hypothetical protein
MNNNFLSRLSVIVLLSIAISSFSIVVQAQDTTKTLMYGDSVTGEITNKAFEVNYQFSGDKGDVLIIKMELASSDGALGTPDILLSDSDGNLIADTTKNVSIGDVVLPVQLTAKGDYTLTATRRDGRAGKSVGAFTLDLIKLSLLQLNQPVTDKVSYGIFKKLPKVEKYYYYSATAKTPIKVAYQKKDGDYAPGISVNVIKDNQLKEVGGLSGDELTDGTIGFVAASNTTYILKVGSALLSFSEGEADYSLTLSNNK